MKNIHLIPILFFSLLCVSFSSGQTRDERLRMKGYINPQEIVSLDSAWSMSQALGVLNEMSKEHAGKVIVDTEKSKKPIGITIVNQHWRDALEAILTQNGLWYEEEQDFIKIVPGNSLSQAKGGPAPAPGEKVEPPPNLDDRDVKISAVFFNANVTKLQDYGISWNFFHAKQGSQPSVDSRLSANITPLSDAGDTIQHNAVTAISSPPNFSFANIDAIIKFFGSNNLGEVITGPEVVVRNRKQGRIQVGRDIYIQTRDIAGNTINQVVSTGTIIDVTPSVFTQSDTDFVALTLKIEQSDVAPDKSITKTAVNTFALLYDGEETVIGGLYTTIDQNVREGIPFLKDLPWWFFGLRYVFGSESIAKTKQELIVLLKAELLPSIRSRIYDKPNNRNLLEKKKKEFQQTYEKN
ncbi:MAG: type II secretion system protein GspD [Bacteroidota bacterium]